MATPFNSYTTPTWDNGRAPAIDENALAAMGGAIELAQHPYGTCESAANASEKLITNFKVSGMWLPYDGMEVRIRFTNGNTAPNPSLVFDSKMPFVYPISSQTGSVSWNAGDVVVFVLDEATWRIVGGTSNSGGGTVDAANRLSTPRTFRTNLGSTSAANFDGTQNVTIGVTGTLPVARGGTGQSSEAGLKTYLENLIGGGGGGNINQILDPDAYPIETTGATYSPEIELGGINRDTGANTTASDRVRCATYIPVVAGDAITVRNSLGVDTCVMFYNSSQTFITGWNSGNSYKWVSSGSSVTAPTGAAYMKFYTNLTTDTSTKWVVYYGDGTPAEFIKQYFWNPKGDYSIECQAIDPGLYKLQVTRTNDEFTIYTIKAPEADPKEATLSLSNNSSEMGQSQFVDFSSLKYDGANVKGHVAIVCQTRNGAVMPDFYVAFNDGNSGRVRKLVVEPDAMPIKMLNNGVAFRRNNNNDNNWTDADTVTINFPELYDKVQSCTRTASGSYVGTGTYGASSPTSIALGFVPKAIFIVANGAFAALVNGYGDISSLNSINNGEWAQRNTVTFGATTSWYTNSATQGFQDNAQYNVSGTTYHYVAFE